MFLHAKLQQDIFIGDFINSVLLYTCLTSAIISLGISQYKIGQKRKAVWKFPGGLSDEGENLG